MSDIDNLDYNWDTYNVGDESVLSEEEEIEYWKNEYKKAVIENNERDRIKYFGILKNHGVNIQELDKEVEKQKKVVNQIPISHQRIKGDIGGEHILDYLELSKDNFIMKYINTMRQMTSSYPEYHFAMAVSILSVISNRKIKISMRHKIIYPNMWFFLLGLSTTAQKSTAIKNLGSEMVGRVGISELNKRRLPGSFSPEGFLSALNKYQNGYLWIDEAGDLLKSMEKDYMSNMRDMLCDLYECNPYYRELKKEIIYIEKPFINMVLATTPDNFKAYTEILDLTSGWLFRFLYVFPEYDKNWMPTTERTNEDYLKIEELVKFLQEKIKLVSNLKGEINLTFRSDALDFYQKWSEKMYYRVMKNKNSIEAAFVGRLEDYVLKLVAIFVLGEMKIKVEIDKDMIMIVCKLAENYFLPMAKKVAEMVEIDEKHNSMDKVLGTIKRNGGEITRTKLIQNTHMKKRELDEIIDTLIDSEEIEKKEGKYILRKKR